MSTRSVGSAPKVGQGVDAWLFRTARLLHTYRQDDEIVALLYASLHGERIRTGAVERAVENSKAAAWQPDLAPRVQAVAGPTWPDSDHRRIAEILRTAPTAADLCSSSPIWYEDESGQGAAEVVELLFSTDAVPDPLLCVGNSSRDFATRSLSKLIHADELANAALIVPSPMCSGTGHTKEGKVSEHTLENTGPRRFLVVEFDQGGTDEQAALLCHLAEYGPLVLVVHSGGKSLHGWFYCVGEPESALHRFMRYAVRIGADRATWTRSQFVRLPCGRRENGSRQHIFYFNPSLIDRAVAP